MWKCLTCGWMNIGHPGYCTACDLLEQIEGHTLLDQARWITDQAMKNLNGSIPKA